MLTITIVSDLHAGSAAGLCPESVLLDDGGIYTPSPVQAELYRAWKAYHARKRQGKHVLVVNGDLIDGDHHKTVSIVTNNIAVQERMAVDLITPILRYYDRVYVVRGTEAHVGASGQSDERIASAIGAEAVDGNHSVYQLWLSHGNVLVNIAHHIGTTSSAAYESSAVMREMVAALVEAAQWRQTLPDIIVRSHRHRYIRVSIPAGQAGNERASEICAVVTPAWQLRTPYVERFDRMRLPHIGGIDIIIERGRFTIDPYIYTYKTCNIVEVK